MQVKLTINPINAPAPDTASERYFEQDIITIGRKDLNDVQLHDQRRLVSSRHAEIRKKGHMFILADLGSKNGTQLNDQRIDAGKEYPLKQDDKIIIGEFIIRLQIIEPEEITEEQPQLHIDSAAYPMDISEDIYELASDLNDIYLEHPHATPEERKNLLAEAIRQTLGKHDALNSKNILDLIESLFPERQYQREKVLQNFSKENRECSDKEYEIFRIIYQGLLRIAGRYFENPDSIISKNDAEKLIDRIDMTLRVMIDCLGSAVKGRRIFEEEFDVEATRIFSWKPNPIKMAEDNRGIGRYLLNWNSADNIDKVASDLEEVFTDLALHQMGLMAGFKECLSGILKQLDPDSIEAEEREKDVDGGALKIAGRLLQHKSIGAWNRFREKHRELSEEEVRTFETILGPHFAKGYLSVQEKKKPS